MNSSNFMKVYANLPVGLRNEIIVVMDGLGPITWNVAYIEIANDTELGKKILTRLREMEIV